MLSRHSLSFLILGLSCAAVAGGFMEPASEASAVKSPVLALGYAHKSGDFSDNFGIGDQFVFDQFDGYQVGFALPVVGSWGLDFTYFSSQSTSSSVEVGPSQSADVSGALQTVGMAISYDLPFSLMESLDVSAKVMVEENFITGSEGNLWVNAANGIGLTGAYRFGESMGLQLGFAYTIPQGVVTAYDSLLTWHASLAYHLS